MPLGTEGVGRFFGALGGSKALRERAASLGRQDAMREALTNAQIGNTQNEAALKGVKLDALDPATLGAAMAGIGVDPSQTSGAAGLVRSGQNVNQVGDFMGKLLQQAQLRQARDAFANGNPNAANEALTVANGKPVDLSKIVDGVSFNPNVTPDQNQFDPTQVGQAMIAARMAQAGASNASAANSYAGAAQKNALTPLQVQKLGMEVAGSGVGKVTPTALPMNVAGALLGKVHDTDGVATADPEAYQQFLTWQAGMAKTDPRFLNSSYAATQYPAHAPVGSKLATIGTNKAGQPNVTSSPLAPQGAVAITPEYIAAQLAGAVPDTGVPAGQALDTTGEGDMPTDTATSPADAPSHGYATPKSEAEYKALPPGTQYMHPDGTLRIKGAN